MWPTQDGLGPAVHRLFFELLFGQAADGLPVAGGVGAFFGSGPLFDLSLCGQGVVFGIEGFDVDALDRAAGVGVGLSVSAGLVFVQAAVRVVGGSDVKRAVFAL